MGKKNNQKNKEKKIENEIKEDNNNKKLENTFFDFDIETNVFDKLSDNKNYYLNKKRNKSLISSTWDYDKILKNEKEIKTTKENKRKRDLKLNNIEEKTNNTEKNNKNINLPLTNNISEESKEEEKEEKEEEEQNIFMKDKFENAVFSKGISFLNFNLSKLIIKGLSEMEFYTPTKVQEKVIPIVINGHDVLVNSETGSGKTACYLLPIIQKIILSRTSKKKNINQALILVPTRELALQCNEMLSKLSKYIDLNFIFLCGGMSVENQSNQIKNELPDIIIATPGRLIDMLYNFKNINLENVNIIVLDEADKLLELGFKDEIMEILNIIKKNLNRQTLLFSATLNPKVIDLGENVLNNPIKIKIAQSAILTNLTQSIVRLKFENIEQNEYEKRMSYLINLIRIKKLNRTIIFFNTKLECHKCLLILNKFNINSCAELHSNINQTERIKSLDNFQKGKVKFLLATDIAGRGIDIEKVRYVINFQMPLLSERYIHRIGRTARKGYLGESITICSEKDRTILKKLLKKEKIDITINFIKIDNKDIKDVYKKLLDFKNEIDEDIINEKTEKEIELAERDVEKTMNIKMYEDEIKSRPKKKWFESKRDKKKREKKMRKEFNKQKEDLYS